MSFTAIITLTLILLNFGISYRGFTNQAFFNRYKFEIDGILINKEYIRLLSSGFLHLSWPHLIFNMLSLYAFSETLELYLGGFNFLILYFISLISGDLLSLFIHRQHGDYSSAGASGAVCGVIFASIVLFPGIDVGLFGIPLSIPGWLYGVLFVAFSIFGIRSQKGNVGHDAHLGGALAGMLVALIMRPESLIQNYLVITLVTLPALLFIFLIITKPHILIIQSSSKALPNQNYTIDDRYNHDRASRQKELDRLLDKISRSGIDSLSKTEKQRLKELSK